jgi:hypothetical protein
MAMSSTSSASVTVTPSVDVLRLQPVPVVLPDVIKFCYSDFKTVKGVKGHLSTAKCNRCGTTIRDKHGTTSGFVRHLSIAAHSSLRKEC